MTLAPAHPLWLTTMDPWGQTFVFVTKSCHSNNHCYHHIVIIIAIVIIIVIVIIIAIVIFIAIIIVNADIIMKKIAIVITMMLGNSVVDIRMYIRT